MYDGNSLAITQDVVVVTINYRTNSTPCPALKDREYVLTHPSLQFL